MSGERRVRIHNVALSVCSHAAELFKNSCCDTIMNLLLRSRKYCYFVELFCSQKWPFLDIFQLRLGIKTVEQIKESLKVKCIAILAAYRRHCASPGSSLGILS